MTTVFSPSEFLFLPFISHLVLPDPHRSVLLLLHDVLSSSECAHMDDVWGSSHYTEVTAFHI